MKKVFDFFTDRPWLFMLTIGIIGMFITKFQDEAVILIHVMIPAVLTVICEIAKFFGCFKAPFED